MTITFLDLYNKITGQAWSMFDGEAEDMDDFELAVTTSIQKALNVLWCSYRFPFRERTNAIETEIGVNAYEAPNGNIVKRNIKGKQVYGVKIGACFLEYAPDFEMLDDEGKPEYFYIRGDELLLYPTPDDVYKVEIEYLTTFAAKSAGDEDNAKATLEEDTDYIDISEKYEHLFLCALLPLAMIYLIASDSDENTSWYQKAVR